MCVHMFLDVCILQQSRSSEKIDVVSPNRATIRRWMRMGFTVLYGFL